jgi:hypothetical protein
MITFIFIFISLIIAGYFKGRLDAIADSGKKSSDWRNKYLLDDKGYLVSTEKKNHWWYFGIYKPSFAEKFPFSTTALVSLTDDWHFTQFTMYRFLYLAMSFGFTKSIIMILLLTFIVFPIVTGISFEFSYLRSLKELRPKTKDSNKKLNSINEDSVNFSEHPRYEQETSVPEKQIEDLEQ